MPWKKGNRLRMVAEEAADPAIRQIYSEIRQALHLPFVPLFYSSLAAYPIFLQMHWQSFAALARSQDLLHAAERLRADGYTRAHSYFRIPDLCAPLAQLKMSEAARHELTRTVDFFYDSDPILLLLFSTQMQALEAPVGHPGQPRAAAPRLVPDGDPVLVAEENAPAAVRHDYLEMRRVLELPYINTEYRALARWPDFLHAFWDLLKSVLQSPIYQECQFRLRETAWSLAAELPGPLETPIERLTEAGMAQENIASVARILELFVKNLSGLVLNIAIAKIALEGGNQLATKAPAPGRPERVA